MIILTLVGIAVIIQSQLTDYMDPKQREPDTRIKRYQRRNVSQTIAARFRKLAKRSKKRYPFVVFKERKYIIKTLDPLLLATTGWINPSLPTPAYALTVTIPANDLHLCAGSLLYRVDNAMDWLAVPMMLEWLNATAANFIGTIPASSSATMVYWKVIINDTAGNILTVDNNGQPFSYSRPVLLLLETRDPPTSIDLDQESNYTVQIEVPQYAQFIANLLIEYTWNDGEGLQMKNMTALSSSLYSYTFSVFPVNATQLNYTIVGVNIYGNLVPLGKDRSIEIIPAMPAWTWTSREQLAVMIISLIVGVICGIIYSSMVRAKLSLRELTMTEKDREILTRSHHRGTIARFWDAESGSAAITFVIIVLLLGTAIMALVMFQAILITMLLFTGLFLALTFLWVLVTDAVVIRTLRSGQLRIPRGSMALILAVGFSIFISLLAILFVGNNVTWWQVRVNQQSYSIGSIQIPQMAVTLASTFFTSILILSWTVGNDVSKTAVEIHELELNHANPGLLLKKREAALSQIQGAVGIKAIAFIAIIGITIIFASNLSVYAVQGLIIIIPFVLGTFVVISIHSLFQKIKNKKAIDVLFDHITTCPVCGAETAVGGRFCENCGAQIIAGKRVIEAWGCADCHLLNPSSAKHCRYCGASKE